MIIIILIIIQLVNTILIDSVNNIVRLGLGREVRVHVVVEPEHALGLARHTCERLQYNLP